MSPSIAKMTSYPRYLYEKLRPGLGTRIIEVGVGYGTYTGWLLEHGNVLATDVDADCLGAVWERYQNERLQVAQLDLNHAESIVSACVGFRGDTVFGVNVLEHVDDDVAALRCLREVVIPGARLLLVVPAHPWLFGPMDAEAGHFRRYSRRSLRAAIAAAGWRPTTVSYVNALGALGWWYHIRIRGATLANNSLNKQMLWADRWLPLIARATDIPCRWSLGLSVVAFGVSL
jgi:SAM-dependent methyltransferase